MKIKLTVQEYVTYEREITVTANQVMNDDEIEKMLNDIGRTHPENMDDIARVLRNKGLTVAPYDTDYNNPIEQSVEFTDYDTTGRGASDEK